MSGDLLRLAERAAALGLQAGADAAEAFVLREAGGSVTLEKNDVASAEWGEQFGIGLRVYREKRLGFAYVTRPERIPAGLSEAFKAGRLSKELAGFRFPSDRAAPRVPGTFDARVLDVDGPALVEGGRRLIDAVQGVREDLNVAGGGFGAGWSEVAIANSEGLARSSKATGTSASLSVVQSRHGTSTGFASKQSTRHDLELGEIGREAGSLAVAAQNPRPLAKGGRWPCLVRPDPAGDLLSTVTLASLEGRAAHRNESYYSGKVGRRVAHATLTVTEDPRTPGGLGSSPFDDEGVPSRRVRPIERGVLRGFLYDAATAREYDGILTSSATRAHPFDGRSYKSPPTAGARQARIEGPSRPTEKLVRGLDRGLLVHDLMGVHTANTVSGDFSVTASVLFRIEKGEVVGPVAPLGIAGNVHRELRRGFVQGDDVKRMGGDHGLDLASVLFDGFTATP